MTALVAAAALSAFATMGTAQDSPDRDNMIDGERFPDGYTPMEIKNGVDPRVYMPGTERLGPNEMRVPATKLTKCARPLLHSCGNAGPQSSILLDLCLGRRL